MRHFVTRFALVLGLALLTTSARGLHATTPFAAQPPAKAISSAGGKGTAYTAKHIDAVAYVSSDSVAPGGKVSLVLEVTPAKGVHVYAPPQTDYVPVTLDVKGPPAVTLGKTVFPASEKFDFKPLNETIQVYMKTFTITQEVTLPAGDELRKVAAQADGALTFSGVLGYQACDDSLCFPPDDMKVSWTVRVKPAAK